MIISLMMMVWIVSVLYDPLMLTLTPLIAPLCTSLSTSELIVVWIVSSLGGAILFTILASLSSNLDFHLPIFFPKSGAIHWQSLHWLPRCLLSALSELAILPGAVFLVVSDAFLQTWDKSPMAKRLVVLIHGSGVSQGQWTVARYTC